MTPLSFGLTAEPATVLMREPATVAAELEPPERSSWNFASSFAFTCEWNLRAYIVMAYVDTAYISTANILMAYVVMAYVDTAYISTANILMAYVVMAYIASSFALTCGLNLRAYICRNYIHGYEGHNCIDDGHKGHNCIGHT